MPHDFSKIEPRWITPSKKFLSLTIVILIFSTVISASIGTGKESADFSYSSSLKGEAAFDAAGWDVAFVGDVNKDGYEDILIGAPENNQGGLRAGAAYLIFGSTNLPELLTPLTQADVTFIGGESKDEAGMKVAGVGDVNGDGFSDFLISAPRECSGTGKVYLIFGKNSGWTNEIKLSDADVIFVGENRGDNAGIAIAFAGDVNNDGLDDFLIGAPRHDNDQLNDAGKAYLIFGKKDGWAKTTNLADADASFSGKSFLDMFGFSVAGVGDINHDEIDDFAIGAPYFDNENKKDVGKVYLFFGKTGSLPAEYSVSDADASLIGGNSDDLLGKYISNAGDINGDGKDDVLVTASMVNSAGKIYMIFGKGLEWSHNAIPENFAPSFIGESANDCAGVPALLDDFNSDGKSDLIIGASKHGDTHDESGKVYHILGRSGDWNQNISLAEVDVFMTGENAHDFAGHGIAGGDFDGNGFPEIAIGAPGNATNGEDVGIVYLYHSPFKPTLASLLITAPNGGEDWLVGSEQHITWTSEGKIENVTLKYSVDSGENWNTIVENTENDGDHLWMVPNQPSTFCLVMVEDGHDGDPFDKSNDVFTISTPINDSIWVISPNGNECFLAGSEHEILWKIQGDIKDVKIQYSTDGGTNWITIINSTANDGSQSWKVADVHSDSCLIKVADLDCDPEDTSDSLFTIWGKAPITVIAPNGGECLEPGQEIKIQWEACCCIDSVKIQYSIDGGKDWIAIINATLNDSSYCWTVPEVHSTNCLVKVADLDCEPGDTSDEPFTIWNKAPITVLSPNGGECLQSGQKFEIKWEACCCLDSLKIQYSIDGGSDWTTIVYGTENDGSFSWTVPNVHSDSCLIKVADLDCDPEDTSDSLFTIWGKAPVTVIYPNGGECLKPGQEIEIKWEACCCLDSLKIQYSTDNGADWTSIIYGTENDSCFTWTVPDVHSDKCLIKVADLDCDPEDVSDSTFTIWGKSPVIVISPNGGECLQSGQEFEIKWEASCCLDSLKLQFSSDGGKDWTTIIYGTENDSSYLWTVPEINSDSCLVKVADLDCDPKDISDSLFTICTPPFITVFQPNRGDTLVAGQQYEIAWHACCFIDTVKIQYSIDNGENWENVIYRTENDSSYVWTVPNVVSDSCLIKVADTDCDPYDVSDSLFTIISAPMANFDASIMTGSEPLEVEFENLSSGNATGWLWSFGDGNFSDAKNPAHTYTIPGKYTVKLKAIYPTRVDSVIKMDFIQVHEKETFAQLAVVNSTPTLPQNDWTNAIDGDIYGWNGTTVLEGEQPELIFSLADSTQKAVNSIGLITDTGIGYEERWIRYFQVQVSNTGIEAPDFQTVLDTTMSSEAMETFVIQPVQAKYVKLVILSPQTGLVHLGEFEVFYNEATTSTLSDPALIPKEFRLSQNYPNPFNPSASIKFELPKECHAKLEVYNILGEKIRTLINGKRNAGIYEIKWDGKNKGGLTMPSGVYLYILSADQHREVKKMILAK